jgi:hypothetical protein
MDCINLGPQTPYRGCKFGVFVRKLRYYGRIRQPDSKTTSNESEARHKKLIKLLYPETVSASTYLCFYIDSLKIERKEM